MQMQEILRLLVETYQESSEREIYGLEICEALGLGPGTVYPLLARLLAIGWVEDRREDIDKRKVGRATRRYYRLSREGVAAARQALAEASSRRRGSSRDLLGRPAWQR